MMNATEALNITNKTPLEETLMMRQVSYDISRAAEQGRDYVDFTLVDRDTRMEVVNRLEALGYVIVPQLHFGSFRVHWGKVSRERDLSHLRGKVSGDLVDKLEREIFSYEPDTFAAVKDNHHIVDLEWDLKRNTILATVREGTLSGEPLYRVRTSLYNESLNVLLEQEYMREALE